MKKYHLLLLFALSSLHFLFAQTPKHRVISIPVERNGQTLHAPWTGGMNSPQFSPCDLNRDGIPDLFVFDRVGNKVLTYINHNNNSDTTFEYAPQYEELFPPDLAQWALIRDYNMDGIPDIFAWANGGVRVFKGSMDNNHLRFDSVSPLLLYNYNNQYDVNIWINVDDIPVFTDVNRDGDIDVLTYGIFGAAVEYYENQTMEHLGDPNYDVDSLKFIDATMCWGNFSENSLTNGINLNETCKGGGGQASPPSGGERHSGSTLYSFDADNDHDVDLLIGDVSFNNIVFVQNCGDSSYANICYWDSTFPSCDVPIIQPVFPAAYGIDADNDGMEDLLIAPDARAGGEDVNNVMYYRNTGNTACQFAYQNDSFLVHHSLDFGTDSKAIFFDFNGDGLMDIVVGNFGYFRPFLTYKSALAVYLNIGTSTSPRFRLWTDDYNLFSNFGLIGMHPAFGDLDGDGKADMIVGDSNGFLQFFKNTGTTQANFPSMTTPQYFGIDVGQYSAPFICDVNGDSLNDLVVGKKDGKISYYWNFGTPSNPQFSQDSVNSYFGNINVNLPGYVEGYTCPFLTKDSAGNMLLFTGSYRGNIFEYLIDPNHLRSGAFQLIDSDLLKHPVGSKSTFSMADLNQDGKMEYLIGNSRGGLTLYSDSVWDPEATPLAINKILPDNLQLRVFPNPAGDYMECDLSGRDLSHPQLQLYNMLGEDVQLSYTVNTKSIRINTSALPKGLYFVRLQSGGKSYTGKILIQH